MIIDLQTASQELSIDVLFFRFGPQVAEMRGAEGPSPKYPLDFIRDVVSSKLHSWCLGSR